MVFLDRRGPSAPEPATEPQRAYIEALRRKHNLPTALLDNLAIERFRVPLEDITKRQASALIDEMAAWADLPDRLKEAKGQRRLF